MKKKLALLLTAVMVAAMVPVSAFAASTNRVTNIATMKAGDKTTAYNTPSIVLEEKDAWTAGDQFELVLDGATWAITDIEVGDTFVATETVGGTTTDLANCVLLSDTRLSIELLAGAVSANADDLSVVLAAKVTGAEATVTVDPVDSKMTAGTYTFAVTTSSTATAKIDGSVELEVEGGGKELKAIIITETVAGALKDGDQIKLRLYGDFVLGNGAVNVASTLGTSNLTLIPATGTGIDVNGWKGANELILEVERNGATPTKAGKLSITNIWAATSDAEAGDVAEIVISGAGLEKTTLEVAKAVSYGYSFTVADKKLPVFYAGRKYDTDETLTVTFKELATNTWWTSRKTTLTFPEGVNVVSADIHDEVGVSANPTITYDYNVVELTNFGAPSEKAEWKAEFVLSISPDFVGDITCTIGGPALPEDTTVVVAEAQYPVTFEVECADVSIDYRNVAVGDITIKETYAGALAEGTQLVFTVDKIDLEGKAKVTVEGDIEVTLDEAGADGKLTLKVDEASYKAPATITISGVEAYLDRALPAGDYGLKVEGNAIFKNSAAKADIKAAYKAQTGDALAKFPVSKYTLATDYIKVVTAGRDQDESTFTTQVAVTVGANTMTVGKAVVALDVPAYIANGYTMLPVRAVADALSGAGATVLWDGATQTVTIAFGARIISMTVGAKVMNINGVAIATTTAPEITNGRTFLGIRDLGYALGLTDADIAWDDATKTATLN